MKLFPLTMAVLSILHIGTMPAQAETVPADFVPVTDAMLQHPDAGDWLMWRRTLNSWGYSPLSQINPDNVATLTLVWSRPMAEGLQEGTPLVYQGRMFMPNPNDVIQAIDAASGELIWEYRRPIPADLVEHIPYPSINRNLAIYGNTIIDNGLDDVLYALDVDTGAIVWESMVLDYRKHPAQQSSGPIIADGKVLSGRGCEAHRSPEACVLTAHDAETGKELWRTSTIEAPTGPSDSWGGYPREQRWHVGSWLVPSYDPELKLVYFGTSVTSPAPKFIFRGNDKSYLHHNSTLALNADTGQIVWHYQHLVDHWDLDHTFERLLLDSEVAPDPTAVRWINPARQPGEKRKLLTGIPGKTGIVYTLDRETGEFLWATPTIQQTVVESIDVHTGAVSVNPAMLFHKVGDTARVCPSTDGGKNWPAGAYSPLTNAMYYPLQNTCMDVTAIVDKPNIDSPYGIMRDKIISPDTDKLGTLRAISASTGKVLWTYEQRAAMTSLVATGSGLLFGGDVNGRFRAFDQQTGKILWETDLGSSITGYPITFAVHGRQYVAVSTGSAVATSGHLLLTPELTPGQSNQLFVFALPE